MKRYVVLAQVMSDEQDKEFIEFLRSKGAGFWHWIDGAWLLEFNDSSAVPSDQIRDKLSDEIAPGKRVLVFEVLNAGTWAGFGPKNEPDNDMFKWLNDHWIFSR